MSFLSKVVWTEGMFLRPQHFQQHDRHWDHQIRERHRYHQRFGWGIEQLQWDTQLLSQGIVALVSGRGIMPDGFLFDIQSRQGYRVQRQFSDALQNQTLFLALPAIPIGGDETDLEDWSGNLTRYQVQTWEVADSNLGHQKQVRLQVGQPRFRLLLQDELNGDYIALPIAQLAEVRGDGAITFDENYIPPCLDVHATSTIIPYVSEVQGLLNHRAEAIASRLTGARSGASEVADFLMLQLINRHDAQLKHALQLDRCHPEELFRQLLGLAAELATFADKSHRPNHLPAYNHRDLRTCYIPLLGIIREALGMVFEQSALLLPLQERKYGVKVAVFPDRKILDDANFYLAIKAEWPKETVIGRLPTLVKAAGVDKLRELVNLQLPGIKLQPMTVAPRQVPYSAGYFYFQLERNTEHWSHLRASGGIALHFSGEVPGLDIQLWAVRE